VLIISAGDGGAFPTDWIEIPKARIGEQEVFMSKKTIISSAQIRAARGLLNWSARELSERSGISQSSIHRAERAEGRPSMHEHSLAAIKAALERYGVEFLGDFGVRLGSGQGGESAIDPSSKKPGTETRSAWAPSSHPWMDPRSTG
jgi:transcriptional regulator with XRE-family HTH domain